MIFSIADLVFLERVGKNPHHYMSTFKFEQLNKTVYHFYKLNKETQSLEELEAEAIAYILEMMHKIPVDFHREQAKYVNYLARCVSSHFIHSHSKSGREVCLDYDFNLVEDDKSLQFVQRQDDYSKFMQFCKDNQEKLFNEREQLIFNFLLDDSLPRPEHYSRLKRALILKMQNRYNLWLLYEYDDILGMVVELFGYECTTLKEDEVREVFYSKLFNRDYLAKAQGLKREVYAQRISTKRKKLKAEVLNYVAQVLPNL